MITVYGKEDCIRCHMTKSYLDRKRVPYNYRDVSFDGAAADQVSLMGYRELPVVAVGDMHWSGFRVDKLNRVIEILKGRYHEDEPDLDDEATAYLMGE